MKNLFSKTSKAKKNAKAHLPQSPAGTQGQAGYRRYCAAVTVSTFLS